MAKQQAEICGNCGRAIGKLETPMVWKGSVVCDACHKRLSQSAKPDTTPVPGIGQRDQETILQPQTKKTWFLRHKILTGVMIVFILFCMLPLIVAPFIATAPVNLQKGNQSAAPPTQSGSQADTMSKIHPDDGKQPQRLALIKKLLRLGVFEKIENDNSFVEVWVTKTFAGLSEKQQNTFLSVVYAYYQIKDGGSFGISKNPLFRDTIPIKIDNGTPLGRTVANYDPFSGIRWK